MKLFDRVKHSSGGPVMTIAEMLDADTACVCRWMAGNDLKEMKFSIGELTPYVEPRGPIVMSRPPDPAIARAFGIKR